MATSTPQGVHHNNTCPRCSGNGYIKAFSHVQGGICFRCWGTGTRPETLRELEAWLDKARAEYRRLRDAGQLGTAAAKQLVREGKKVAAKVEGMKARKAA